MANSEQKKSDPGQVDRKMGRFFVQARIWKLEEGIVQELKFEDHIFVIKRFKYPKKKKSTYPRNVKISYLQKWIQEKEHLSVFTLDQFFKDYPKQKQNKRLNFNISKLISEKKIRQLSNNKFQVL